jgi:hypothetical protein
MSKKAFSAQDENQALRGSPASASVSAVDLDPVRLAVKGIRYGEVRVIIQDGVIVQIERVEKQRLR